MAARDPMAIPRRTPALVTERSVAFDAVRGVYTLKATRTLARPPLEQVEVWRRLSLLQAYLDTHGRPPPAVRWMRETVLQRLARLRRRAADRKRWAGISDRLEGVLA